MQIGIIWATPYATNLGVSALAYSTIALIDDVLKEKKQKATFVFIGTSRWGKDFISIGNKTHEIDNIATINFISDFSAITKHQLLRKILKLNIVFDIAAGDSFSDIYGVKRFQRILFSKKIFHFLGKRQVLLPQTIGPFNDPKIEKAAFNTMKKLSFIMCRDKQSYDYCENFIPNDKLQECIDLAFYLPYTPITFDRNKIHVGINLSGLLWNGGYTENNQFNLKIDYKDLMRSIISLFYSNKDIQLHFIGHVIHHNNPGLEDDYTICELLKKEYPNALIAPKFNNPIDAKNYISGMDFFTGARMHSCIGAFSSGVATYPLAYSRKFNGLFKDTLQYQWMADCTNEDKNDIIHNLQNAFQNREMLKRATIKSNKTIVKERIEEIKLIIANSLKI
ncbi:polysaccharide pyruvyl transferase family protein [Parabacteroides sp. Marseille-P3160]|uniref:polysaccharide pyruvyl transferase family protein n=1 Tax=Parabacteroides sp. Marseille-P3160 TaxID=1917887 RepID=UPI0009BB9B42|nr:polysaccharide pyruvyl transferase family protein [Parabacteroides sp. Marseille-P3160]